MNPSISILTEIPEELYNSLRDYLDAHPTWDQDQVFTVALSLFLLQSQQKRPVQLFPIAPAIFPCFPKTEPVSYLCSSDRN